MSKVTIDYSNKKFLVIDDFADIRRSIRDMLEDMGAQHILLAASADEAINICRTTKLNIVLSDYNLGKGKDGQQILEELHFRNYITKHMIFIMCTAESSSAMVMGAIEYAPDGYLTKPFNKKMLQSRLDKLIHRKDIFKKVYDAELKRNYSKALEECEAIKKEYPRLELAADMEIGEIYEKTRRFTDAKALYESIASSKPLPWALVGAARNTHKTGELEEARNKYEQIISQFPMLIAAYDGLAELFIEMGQQKDAIRILKEASERSPKAIFRQNTLGKLAKEEKDFDTAIQSYKQSVKYAKNSVYKSPENYYNLVSSVADKIKENPESASMDNINEAREYLNEYQKEYKGNIGDEVAVDILQSKLLSSMGREAESAKLVRKNLGYFQEKKPAMFEGSAKDFVNQLVDIGEGEAAEDVVRTVIANSGLDDDVVSDLAKVADSEAMQRQLEEAHEFNVKGAKQYEKGDIDKALELFSKAIKLAPHNISSNLNLAQVLLKKTETTQKRAFAKQAMECLSRIHNLDSQDPKYQRYSSLLKIAKTYI